MHKADCVNALHTEPERAIAVSWAEEEMGDFSVNVQIICYDHNALLGELTSYIDELGVTMTAIAVKINRNKTCSITATLQVKSREQLDSTIKKLLRRSDVIEAYRSVN